MQESIITMSTKQNNSQMAPPCQIIFSLQRDTILNEYMLEYVVCIDGVHRIRRYNALQTHMMVKFMYVHRIETSILNLAKVCPVRPCIMDIVPSILVVINPSEGE